MRAFKIYLNGKELCVAGVEQGDISFGIGCGENSHGRGGIGLNMTGLIPTREVVRWLHRSLQMNDEVKIKIVEVQNADAFEVLQPAPRDVRKYEKAAVRRLAKEFGWTIQTKSGSARKRLKAPMSANL